MDEEEDGSVRRLLQAAWRGDVDVCVALMGPSCTDQKVFVKTPVYSSTSESLPKVTSLWIVWPHSCLMKPGMLPYPTPSRCPKAWL